MVARVVGAFGGREIGERLLQTKPPPSHLPPKGTYYYIVGNDARKVVMEEFSWWHVMGAIIRFDRLEIC